MARSQFHHEAAAFDFSGGVNSAFSKTQLAPNEAASIRNGHLDVRGGVEKRGGYTPWVVGDTATGNAIAGLFQHRTSSAKYVLRIQGTAIHSSNGGGAWSAITGTETITTGQNNRWVFQQFRDSSIFTNGVDIPLKWTGSGNVAKIARAIAGGADTIDKAATLVRHRERTILGDVTATESAVQSRYESVIWPSDSGTLDTWSAAPTGKIHIDRGDGDSITNLQDLLGYLVVFKQHSLHRVIDLGVTATQDRIRVAPIGTPGPHTAVVDETFVYFLDTVGRLWRYDVRGDNEDAVVELSRDKLGDDTLSTFVKNRLPYAHLLLHKKRQEIYCFLTADAGSATNIAWVYNIATGGFSKFDWALNWNASITALDGSDNEVVLLGSSTGLVAKADTGLSDGYTNLTTTTDGTAITFEIETRQMPFDFLGIFKRFDKVDVYGTTSGESANITLEHFLDFASTGNSYVIDIGTGGGDVLG